MKIEYVALLLAVVSLGFAVWSYTELLNTRQAVAIELDELRSQNKALNDELITLKQALASNITQLNSQLENLEEKFETTIQTQQQKIIELNQSLTEFETLLADRISWIKSNSNIGNVPYYETTKFDLAKCYDGRINLGCIWFLLHDKEGIDYIYETGDELTNLTTIYERRGGDCEDLSLLYAATVRYAMQKYGDNFAAWRPGLGEFTLYSTADSVYYIPDADDFSFKADYIYVTCYGSGYEGHCAVSFCKDPVTEVQQLYNCTLIEPQSYGMLSQIEGEIWLYISADDLCMNLNETKCFSDFMYELEKIV